MAEQFRELSIRDGTKNNKQENQLCIKKSHVLMHLLVRTK